MDAAGAERASACSAELKGLLHELQREHSCNRALMQIELGFLDHLMGMLSLDGVSGYDTQRLLHVHHAAPPPRRAARPRPAAPRAMSIPTLQGLQTALSGLLAEQQALDVTGNNIANANTEGYSRETAVLETEPADRHPGDLVADRPGRAARHRRQRRRRSRASATPTSTPSTARRTAR